MISPPCKRPSGYPRRWIILALIFFGIVINYIDRGSLSIAAPSLMRDFRMSPATMGVVLSAFLWTYAISQFPAGTLVDRLGIRWSYAGGFLIWSMASASMALCATTGQIISSRLVLGLAESTAPMASVAFMRKNFAGEDQGLPMAIYIAGQNVGPAIGALVGAILITRYGWRMMFAITGLVALIWLPFWLIAVPADEKRPVRRVEKAAENVATRRPWTWRMVLSDRTFWAMCFSILLSSYFWYFSLTWIPSYLILSRGFSTLGMGKVLSIALFTMAVVNIFAGSAVDRLAARIGVFRARLWFGVVGYFGTAAILLLVIVPGRSWVLPILTFSMCATGIGNTNFWTISEHASPKDMVARIIGFLNTISVVGGIAAPIITGWLIGPKMHFGPAIFVAGLCAAVAGACLLAAGSQGLGRIKALLAGESYVEA
ncbi:MAG: MFS transporter [Terriglobia bacterium]